MLHDLFAATIAGLIGTTLMTGMMLAGRKMGLPAVDVQGVLGYVTRPDRPSSFGYISHWVLGAAFAIAYVPFFWLISGNILVWGVVLGTAHWLVVGWMFIYAPKVHAGMKAGMVKEAGPYMLNALGVMGFIGGLMGHIVFGVIVAAVYAWLGGSFGQVL